MKTDTILSKAETRVVLCYVFGLIGKEAATVLNVSYNTNLGEEFKVCENLGMVMKEAGRRIGAMCLIILLCAYTFLGGDFERTFRRARRGRRNEVEYLIEG